MAKKKQPDFQPTKLKPGHRLPKGKNITKASFRTKKIIVQKRLQKEKAILSIPDALKQLATQNTSSNVNTLNHLRNLIEEKDEFFQHIPDILNKLSSFLLEYRNSVRSSAINVLDTLLKRTSDTQIETFSELLTCILSCGLSNANSDVKRSSLTILNVMLKTHPDVITQSSEILKKLVNMLHDLCHSKIMRNRKPSANQNLLSVDNGTSYAVDLRIEVFILLKMFFEAILERKKKILADDGNEQEVFWDCNGPLHLIIYSVGGLKPVDIENLNISSVNYEIFELENSKDCQEFLSTFIPLLYVFIREVVTCDKSSSQEIHCSTAENLIMVFQILNHVGEWVKLLSDFENELDKFYSRILDEKIFKYVMKEFPFGGTSVLGGDVVKVPVQLNLTICNLYTAFVLDVEHRATDRKGEMSKEKVHSYLKSIPALMDSGLKHELVPILVKIAENCLSLNNSFTVGLFKDIVLFLFEIWNMPGGGKKITNRRLLFSFFLKLSLDPVYEYMFKEENAKSWFSGLFVEMKKMVRSGMIETKLLKTIQRIANRKHSAFLDCLKQLDIGTLKGFLMCKNEDVIDTTIFLINNMRNISDELLEVISNIILRDPSFPPRMASRFIQLLSCRFSEADVCRQDRVNFIQFIINIAIDAVNAFDEVWADHPFPVVSGTWNSLKEITVYTIYPSLRWKEHSQLFEVCYRCLGKFPQDLVSKIMSMVNKAILVEESRILPVHCVIALLRLCNLFLRYDEILGEKLTYSSFLFLSIFTTVDSNDEWYRWNVVELMNSLELTRNSGLQTCRMLHRAIDSITEPIEGIAVHYIMRIILFFFSKKMLLIDDGTLVMSLLEMCIKNCKDDENLKQQTLYVKLTNIFSLYYR